MRHLIVLISVFFACSASASCLFEGQQPYFSVENIGEFEASQLQIVRDRIKDYSTAKFHKIAGDHLLAAVSALPDLSMYWNLENICEKEFLILIENELFANEKIEFSPRLLASIEAIAKLPMFFEGNPIKSRILLKLFHLPESTFTEWQDNRPIYGPVGIAKVHNIKVAVARAIAESNLTINDQDITDFVVGQHLRSKDYVLRHILHSSIDEIISFYFTQDHEKGREIFRAWVSEVEALLETDGYESIYPFYEIINIVLSMRKFEKEIPIADLTSPLLKKIEERNGEFPLSKEVFEGPAMLRAAAYPCGYSLRSDLL